MAVKNLFYSFLPGTGKVAKQDYSNLQDRLYEAMGCSSLPEYYRKRKRYMNIPAHLKQSIEDVFNEFGVDSTDIWNITSE